VVVVGLDRSAVQRARDDRERAGIGVRLGAELLQLAFERRQPIRLLDA
jgi:hypothetical protein